MGVRGLTTFINNNKWKYMEHYELHDTNIVIDGNNIACQLYKWHCKRNDCFGGDYDKYAKVVFDFFALLRDCNVTPIVVFDGGYENKKIKTVYSRMKKKVHSAKFITSSSQSRLSIFPILMNNLFSQIVVKLNHQIVRTDFEADYEMACLAQNLKCPVLSYDSDFYIFDVVYLPFSTFQMEKFKLNKTQYYIKCEVYTIDNFIAAYPGLSRTTLPLMATLLGNDYIRKGNFKPFYNELKIAKGKLNNHQQTIITLLKWMQTETYSSAVKKICNRMKKKRTRRILSQIKFITRGYICRKSILLSFLDIEVEDDTVEPDLEVEMDEEDGEDDSESSEEDDDDDDANLKSDNEDPISDDDEDIKCDDENSESDCEIPKSDEEDSKTDDEDSKSEDEDPKIVDEHKENEDDSKNNDEDSESENEDPKIVDEHKENDEDPKCDNVDQKRGNNKKEKLPVKKNFKKNKNLKNNKNVKTKIVRKPTRKRLTIKDLPAFFLQNFRKCKYPSNFMDILTRNLYFCIPQVENYSSPTSYAISVNILSAINNILTSGTLKKVRYVSRNRRRGLRHFSTPPCTVILPKLSEVENLNREELKVVLLTVLGIKPDEIGFLDDLPENWHLYFLGILYWIRNSDPKVTNSQLYSLILCMLVLSIVDPQVGFIRSNTKFSNKLDGKLKALEKTKPGNGVLPEGANFKKLLGEVTYNHCILALKELITYFQMESKMVSRATNYNIEILHPFAELQTCLLHIQYLNMLLSEPFQNFLISDFYDGTFIYNMTVNLIKRFDIDVYLNGLLGQSSSILLCGKFLFNEIFKLSSENITKTVGRRRRKRNKNKTKLTVLSFVDEDELEVEGEDEVIVDVNNKYSLLNLIK